MSRARGEQAFDTYFASIYAERWPQLKRALLKDDAKVARQNLFFKDPLNHELKKGVGEPHAFLKNCFVVEESFDLQTLQSPLLPFYRMDPASILAARALEVQPGETVLDMCAAPGGKTLVLMEDLVGEEMDLTGALTANEISAKRKFRMMSVFKRYLPKEVRSMIQVKGVDGSIIGLKKKDFFDRILLDAPCSGERGVVQKKSDLEKWTEKRSKNYGVRQYALLSSAFMALKKGGRILYSTCSISPYENDEVIAKLHKRKQGEFEVIKKEPQGPFESTDFGYQFLPDQQGWGPIYFSMIEKS
jgi:16S rRNA C967 or C1407 C5-methylase (RsmB/RsmF family)